MCDVPECCGRKTYSRFVRVKGGHMKRVLLLIICIGLFGGSISMGTSEKKKNISAILERLEQHYEERMQLFRKENRALKNKVFLGDSLTEGFDLGEHFPEWNTLNRGIVADHVGVQGKPGVLQRLEVSVFDCNPSEVFLLIGVNDLADDDCIFEKVVEGFREIITTIQRKAPEVDIYVQTCLPARGKYSHLNPVINRYNEAITTTAEERDCPVIDLYPLFLDDNNELREDLTRDGIHLTSEGYDIWAAAVKQFMVE